MWGEFWSSRKSWRAFSSYPKLLPTWRVPWKFRGHNVAALVRQARLIKWKIIIIKKSAREFTLGRHYSCLKITKWYTRTREVVRSVDFSFPSSCISLWHTFELKLHAARLAILLLDQNVTSIDLEVSFTFRLQIILDFSDNYRLCKLLTSTSLIDWISLWKLFVVEPEG